MSAGEAAIAQLERDLAAAQAQLAAAQAKVTAAQEDAAEKDKIIKCVFCVTGLVVYAACEARDLNVLQGQYQN